MSYYNRFVEALDQAVSDDVKGAEELRSLFNILSDDAEGEELMGKLDAYQCDASPEAQALYYYLMK